MYKVFPDTISNKAIVFYFISLILCSLLYSDYSLDFQWVLWGSVEVLIFFYFTQNKSNQLKNSSPAVFTKKIFYIALTIRVLYVIFSYLYFEAMTGSPFEYDSMDAQLYDMKAKWLELVVRTQNFKEFDIFIADGISDVGYVVYLGFIYFIFNDSIFFARIIKAILGSITCVFVYKLTVRNFGEMAGRIAAIMCVFSPNLIFYCGLHLKEVEMVFLTLLFIDRADWALRQNNLKIINIIVLLLIAMLTFSFRTVLGVVLFCSFGLAVLLSSHKLINKSKKIVIAFFSVLFVAVVVLNSTSIMKEVTEVVNEGGSQQKANMEWRSRRENGNKFAKFAGAAVFAPLVFTIPFPTMVETPNQYHQKMLNGGNYCKNIISFFTIIALFFLIKNKLYKNHILILSFFIGYLIVLVFSRYAQSERFHMPVLPFTFIFASYGLTYFKSIRIKKLYQGWLLLIMGAIIFWNWFKLAGRDMI